MRPCRSPVLRTSHSSSTTSIGSHIMLDSEAIAVAELRHVKEAGGRTIVEATTQGIGRNPLGSLSVSNQTGLNIVIGSGFYVGSVHPPALDHMSVKDIEELLVKELQQGADGTTVKPGIIGELGTSWPLSENEKKVLCAAAKASLRTGASVNVHPGRHEQAPIECVKIIKAAVGQEVLSRVIVSHIDRTLFEPGLQLELAKTGSVLEFDMPNDEQRISWISQLAASGYSKQIVVSHDIYTKHRLRCFGGHGYDHLLLNILPRMRKREITETTIVDIFEQTPARLLTLQ